MENLHAVRNVDASGDTREGYKVNQPETYDLDIF